MKPTVIISVLLGLAATLPNQAWSIYLCQDEEGRQILTDRPAQLRSCATMDLPSSPPAGSARPAPSPAQPSPPAPGEPADRAGPSHPHATGTTIPIQRAGHLFLATVKMSGNVGESEGRLIVDTGASHTIVSHKLALELGLFSDSQLGTVTMNTVGGPVQAPLARMKSIRIGEVEVVNSLVIVHDLRDMPGGVEGLLGLSTLQNFQVTLDPNGSILSLKPVTREPSK